MFGNPQESGPHRLRSQQTLEGDICIKVVLPYI